MASKPKLTKSKVMEKLRDAGYKDEKKLSALDESLIFNMDFSREELIIAYQIRNATKKGLLYSYLINPDIDLNNKEGQNNGKQI